MVEGNRKNRIQSLTKAFLILEKLAEHGGSIKLKEISQSLKIPPSSVHRVLNTLLDMGYIQQNLETGEYTLGLKILFLSSAVLNKMDLREMAKPILQEVRDLTKETVNLVVLNSDEVLYIEKAESTYMVRVFSLIGDRAPVHATGAGKVFLAHMAWSDVEALLERKGMRRLTENTITQPQRLLKELNQIRLNGYAIDTEECEEGAMCVATPIKNHTGKTIAAMSISGLTSRFTEEKTREYIQVLMEKAGNLSRLLGYKNTY